MMARGDAVARAMAGRRRRSLSPWIAAALLAAGGSLVEEHCRAATPAPVPELTAEQIVAKNVAARGGLDAWRKIGSMAWVGHMESTDASVPRLAFELDQKRPNKTRFELDSMAEKTMRLFDGTHGWRLRPRRDGSLDTQPYSPQDLKFARDAQGIDGPLIDYQAKGNTVRLAGVETIEGRETYRLEVRQASGDEHDVWIDAGTFLDAKYDRISIGPTGAPVKVSVIYRDYKTIEGLKIPGTLEIAGGPNAPITRMVIEKIALNPPLEDKVFKRPEDRHRSRMATVEIEGPKVDPRNAFGPPHP